MNPNIIPALKFSFRSGMISHLENRQVTFQLAIPTDYFSYYNNFRILFWITFNGKKSWVEPATTVFTGATAPIPFSKLFLLFRQPSLHSPSFDLSLVSDTLLPALHW